MAARGDDQGWEPLPPVVFLAPDYQAGNDAGSPPRGEDGQVSWRPTRFSPGMARTLHAGQPRVSLTARVATVPVAAMMRCAWS